jgi:hypothetical protein
MIPKGSSKNLRKKQTDMYLIFYITQEPRHIENYSNQTRHLTTNTQTSEHPGCISCNKKDTNLVYS